MEEIKWEEPEKSQRQKTSKFSKLATACIENPGEWAVLMQGKKVYPAPRPFNGPTWERAYRIEFVDGENAIHKTYVRYIGLPFAKA